jgi:hypothetical protein
VEDAISARFVIGHVHKYMSRVALGQSGGLTEPFNKCYLEDRYAVLHLEGTETIGACGSFVHTILTVSFLSLCKTCRYCLTVVVTA